MLKKIHEVECKRCCAQNEALMPSPARGMRLWKSRLSKQSLCLLWRKCQI